MYLLEYPQKIKTPKKLRMRHIWNINILFTIPFSKGDVHIYAYMAAALGKEKSQAMKSTRVQRDSVHNHSEHTVPRTAHCL